MLKELRKGLRIKSHLFDKFIGAKQTSTKYYLEKNLQKNKLFRYLLFLRINKVNLNKFFDDYIKTHKDDIEKWKS